MKKCVIFILIFLTVSTCVQKKSNDIEWNAGIAFRNGKAIYFDPHKLYTIEFYISPSYLTNQRKYYPIFPGGTLFWLESNLSYYSVPVTNNPNRIIKSEKVLYYKVSNEAIYLKDDTTDWEKMEFRLIKEEPKPGVEFLIYLKSRWFEGEYYIYEP